MRTVGTTLLLGISVTFILSMIMVPALIQLLRYRKTPNNLEMSTNQTLYVSISLGVLAAFALSYSEAMTPVNAMIMASMLSLTIALGLLDSVWDAIGKIPVRATIVVMLVAIITTAWGVLILEEELGKDIQVHQMRYLRVGVLRSPQGIARIRRRANQSIHCRCYRQGRNEPDCAHPGHTRFGLNR